MLMYPYNIPLEHMKKIFGDTMPEDVIEFLSIECNFWNKVNVLGILKSMSNAGYLSKKIPTVGWMVNV